MRQDFFKNPLKHHYDSIALRHHEPAFDRLLHANGYLAKVLKDSPQNSVQNPATPQLVAYHLSHIEDFSKKSASMFGTDPVATSFAILSHLIRLPDFQKSPENQNKTAVLKALTRRFDRKNKNALKIVFRACAACLDNRNRPALETALESCAQKATNLQLYEVAQHVDFLTQTLRTRRADLRSAAIAAQQELALLRAAQKTAPNAEEKSKIQKKGHEIKKELFKREDQYDRRQDISPKRHTHLFARVLAGHEKTLK